MDGFILTHPTLEELRGIWRLSWKTWGAALSEAEYLEREEYLMTVPMCQNGGITHWVLVDPSQDANNRDILASCETLRKHAVMSEPVRDGARKVMDCLGHGVGSVFCDPRFRGRGYVKTMMRKLAETLPSWQSAELPSAFSVLWSDIGPNFYAQFGWKLFPSSHIELPAANADQVLPHQVEEITSITDSNIAEFCDLDVRQVRASMLSSSASTTLLSMLPSYQQMQWHHMRENFLCGKLFHKTPTIRGMCLGQSPDRVWMYWTRSYYGPLTAGSHNTLHILRLVIEEDLGSSSESQVRRPGTDSLQETANRVAFMLKAAQIEARDWKCEKVEIWDTSAQVEATMHLVVAEKKVRVVREAESLAGLLWFGSVGGDGGGLEWIGNEKYPWC